MANSLGNAYVKIRGDIGDLRSDLDKALATIKSMESKVVDSNKNIQNAFDKVDKSIKNIVVSVLSFEAAKKAFDVGKELVDAGLAAEKLSTAMYSATGSYNAAQSAMSFLRSEAARLGTDLASSTGGFIKLTASARGTSLEGEKTRDIFTAVSTAATALKLSNDEASGAIYAISQMMSKGTVQAEELRGQLGERLPGAFNLAAKAMGVTTAELDDMLKKGQVVASDFLPKLARVLTEEYGAAASKSADTTQAAVNRMNNSWEELKRTLGEDLLPTVVRVVEKLNSLIQMLTPEKFEGIARVAQLQEKVTNLQDRMTQPGMKWVLGDEFERAQKELKTLTYSMAGVTEQTGQWAKGMSALAKDENNLLYPAKEGWQNFKEGLEKAAKTTAYDQIKDKTLDVTKQTEKLTEQLKSSTTYQDILSAKGVDAAESWVKAAVKSETHHEKASTSMKAANKSAEEYTRAIQGVSDKYNQLTMSADEYASLQIWQWYEKEAAILGQNNEALQAARDLALQKIATDGEQAQSIKEITNEYNKLILSAKDYEMLELKDWFKKETDAINGEKDALEKLNAVYASRRAKILYGDEKDMWVDYYKGKVEADERANELIKDQEKETASDVNKIWDKAWKNIESSFADSIYDMMENGIDSFDDFFDNILKMFEKLLAEMVSAWLVSGLKTLLTGGEGAFSLSSLFNMGSAGVSATDAAGGALSLASAYDSIAAGLTYVTDALGITAVAATTAAESVAAAAAVQATSTAAAAATMEGIADAAATAATATEALGAAAVETSAAMTNSVAAFEAMEASAAAGGTAAAEMSAMSTLGAAAAVAGVVYFIGSGEFQSMVEGLFMGGSPTTTTTEDMYNALKAAEAGLIQLDKETTDLYKTALLWESSVTGYNNSIEEMYDEGNLNQTLEEWIASNQELLSMSMAEYDKIIAQQKELMEVAYNTQQYGMTTDTMGTQFVEVAVKIAEDATMPLEQKMYQLGFVASQSGGWETDATMAMLAEFSDQGVPWSEINKTMIAYGVTDEQLLKEVYVQYNNVSDKESLAVVEEYLALNNLPDEVLKTVKYIYESNVPFEDMMSWLTAAVGYGGAGLSEEEAIKLMGIIDPSDEWYDLVIPVDAPSSIPVSWDGQPTGMATGGPVSAGVPYIIGEVGPELFVPQESGHILSNANMKKLMGMGVQGFADGTTDDWEDPFAYMDEINQEMAQQAAEDAANQTYDPSPSSNYETLAEWQADYNKQLEEYLGLSTDLGDALSEISDYYVEQEQIAAELGATEEELAALRADGAEVWMKAVEDWYASEEEYYNQMMGYTTELGDTLAGISQHYDEAIASAEAAGMSEQALADIQTDAAAVMQKAIDDWYASYEDYYNSMMGLTTALGGQIDAINEYYKNAMAEADIADPTGALSDSMAADQAAMVQKAIDDFYQSELDYYNDLMGLNTELGDTLDGINQHYDDAIASAEAAGMSEEELAALREMEAAAAQKAIEDWYASYEDYYNSMMGLTTSLGDQIEAINEYYASMMAEADIADPTGALSDSLAEDQADMIQKVLDDAVEAYEDYYNSMMGLTTALGDEIDKINEYYAEQIANANAADPTGAAASALAEDQAEVIQKAIEDWAQSYSDYVDDMLGNTSDLADEIAEVNEYYAEQLATAEAIGMTQEEINQMLADQAAIQQQILEDYVQEYNEWLLDTLGIHNDLADSLKSITDYYDQMLIDLDGIEASDEAINQLLAQEQAVLEVIAYQTLVDMAQTMAEINGYATEMSSQLSDIAKQYAQMLKDAYVLVQMDLARPITLAIIAMSAGLALLNVVGKSRADEEAQAIEDISNASQDRYDAESQAIDDLKSQMDDLQNIVDSITDKMQDLKYSKYNLSLPSQTMANASEDYASLLAKAQTGDADAIAAYMDFVDTYLQSAQDQYKSGADYQAIYDQVMKDLAGVQTNAQDQLTLDQQLLTAMEAELASISTSSGTTAENTEEIAAQETIFSNIAAVLTTAASVLNDFVANYAEDLPILTAVIDRVATAMETMAERLTEISEWFIEGMTNGFPLDGTAKDYLLNIYTNMTEFVTKLNSIGNVIGNIGVILGTIGYYLPGKLTDLSTHLQDIGQAMVDIGSYLADLSPSLSEFFADMKTLAEYIQSLAPQTEAEAAAETAKNTYATASALGALNNYLKVPGYYEEPLGYADGGISTGPTSGYPVTLHGTEAIIPLSGGAIPVTLSGGQSDPEVKALLQELVAVSRGKQNVTITTDDGVSFRGYIRREADTVRIEAASRPGMETKRIYN